MPAKIISIETYKSYRKILKSAFHQYDSANLLFHQIATFDRIVPFHIIQCWKILAYFQGILSGSIKGDQTSSEVTVSQDMISHLDEKQKELWKESYLNVQAALKTEALSKSEANLKAKDVQNQLKFLKRTLCHYEKYLLENSLYKDRVYQRSKIVLFSVLILSLLCGILYYLTRPEDSWLLRAYNNKNLSGVPWVQRVQNVNFNWGTGSPAKKISSDEFSVRFDTCLVIDKDIYLFFKLSSDDGSRLFIDDKLVLNLWRNQSFGGITKKVALKQGVRNVRVEYYDHKVNARVALEVSRDSKNFSPLSHKKLFFPGLSEPSCKGKD